MIINTESYINRPYLPKYSSITTCLVCCAALSYGRITHDNCHSQSFDNTDKQCGYNQEVFRNEQTPSWISFDNISNAELNSDTEVVFDALTSFDILKKLAFMAVDEEADRRIEEYFASKSIKTRTILENHRINKG